MNETWTTVIFLVVIPLLQQGFKLYRDKTGKTLSKVANQTISIVLSVVLTLVTGGFLGLVIPVFPVWSGDVMIFIGGLIGYLGNWVTFIGLAWAPVVASYELVWDKLFVKVRLATADKLS